MMPEMSGDSNPQTLEGWRESMDASIRKENGWLALAGLIWLHEGENRFGSAASNDIVLPATAAPPIAGSILLEHGEARLQVFTPGLLEVDGRDVDQAVLEPDTSGDPNRITLGPLAMIILERGSRTGVRLWDNSRAARLSFPRRIWFPEDPSWRILADFHPHDPPRLLQVPTALGDELGEAGVGRVTFISQRAVHHLEALGTDAGGLWLIFGDRTNGNETYPSGRFVTCPAPEAGKVLVDFNRAYSPPCAFSMFATCPLPPAQNLLDLRVEAGERFVPHPGALA
jgi:uncharacterized protein (DUF1684 family)